MDRRAFLSGGAALALAAGLPKTALAARSPGEEARVLYDRVYEAILKAYPQTATSLGVDTGARRSLRHRLGGGRLQDMQPFADFGPALKRIDRAALSPAEQVDYDTVAWLTEVADKVERTPFGGVDSYGYPVPYVVSQLTGSYQAVPDFMDNQHPLETEDDADAYVDRLSDFARNVRRETDRSRADAGRGVIPPDFVIDKTLVQLTALIGQSGADNVLVSSIGRRAPGDKAAWAARAQRVWDRQIVPALNEQIAWLSALKPRAGHAPAARRLPDGEAYYALCLRHHTTTDYTPDQAHDVGLEQVAEITARADALLRAQGLTQGTVGERLTALGREPRHLYPNTDAGRAELLAALNQQVQAIEARLPQVFATLPRARVEVRRVPPSIELGAPRGYAQSPSLDGSRPGAYYINLADTGIWPKWALPTLTYHESLPGHHLQGTLALEAEGGSTLRKIIGFNAYNEGWALYAEQLADEMGVYAHDPLGRVGMLQSFLYRAARVVIDTGLHWKGWSREQAIAYMIATVGLAPGAAETEIDRYCVWPGQATGYKIGHTEIDRLRERARARLGARFDIKGFHDAVLLGGSVPLAVLGRVVDAWAERG